MRGFAGALLAAAVVAISCMGQRVASPMPRELAPAEPVADHAQFASRDMAATTLLQKISDAPAVPVVAAPAVNVLSAKEADDQPAMGHVWQSLNNCGPASVVMLLSTFGVNASQEDARLALRGPDWRRGMSPAPVNGWVKENWGLRSIWRNNGSAALLKQLISNGFSPMITQWMQDPSISRIAHWRTVRGYDDARGVFYTNDPMLGRGVALSYDWFDRNWQPFSYRYLVLYRPDDEAKLKAIVGSDWNDRDMRRNFYERTKAEAHDQGTAGAWQAYAEAAYQYGMFAESVAAFEKGMSITSAQPFTTRSSYPAALRALGRQSDAQAAAEKLNRAALVPSATVVAPPTDAAIMELVRERSRDARYNTLRDDEDRPSR